MEPLNFTTIAIISLVGLTGLYFTTAKTPSIKTPFLFVLLFLGLFLGSNAQTKSTYKEGGRDSIHYKTIDLDCSYMVKKTKVICGFSVSKQINTNKEGFTICVEYWNNSIGAVNSRCYERSEHDLASRNLEIYKAKYPEEVTKLLEFIKTF